MWKVATVASIVGLGLVATGYEASAGETGGRLSFCTAGSNGCGEWQIFNDALVVVTGVNIFQKASGGDCEEKKLHHSADLSTKGLFFADVDEDCRYRVVFKTTKGCGGDKDAQADANERRKVRLKGSCGSLSVAVNIKSADQW